MQVIPRWSCSLHGSNMLTNSCFITSKSILQWCRSLQNDHVYCMGATYQMINIITIIKFCPHFQLWMSSSLLCKCILWLCRSFQGDNVHCMGASPHGAALPPLCDSLPRWHCKSMGCQHSALPLHPVWPYQTCDLRQVGWGWFHPHQL